MMPINNQRLSDHDRIAHQLQPILQPKLQIQTSVELVKPFFEIMQLLLFKTNLYNLPEIKAAFKTQITNHIQTYALATNDAQLADLAVLNAKLITAADDIFNAMLEAMKANLLPRIPAKVLSDLDTLLNANFRNLYAINHPLFTEYYKAIAHWLRDINQLLTPTTGKKV